MADADVAITAGSGTKVDTRTVGGSTDEHRQVVVVGDPATAANVAGVTAGGAVKTDGSATTQPVSIAALPNVDLSSTTLTALETISVNNFPATQPVSGTVSLSGAVPAGNNNIGDVDIASAPDINLSATTLAALETIQVGNWPSVQPVNDNGGSLTVDGSVSVSNFPAIQPVSGTVTANAGTGPFPVSDNAGSLTTDTPQLPAALVSGRLSVDGSGVTQPVSLASVPTVTEKQDQPASTTATWTSATSVNTALTNSTVTGYGTATISIQTPSTITAGVITIEVSDEGTTWYPAGAVRVDTGFQESVIPLALTPGIARGRMWAASVDAMTHIRARLSTAITGAGNTVVRIGLVGSGIEPFVATAPRKVATYRAIFRATTRPYNLSHTFTANTRKQWATIHHAAAAVRTVRLRYVGVCVVANLTALSEYSVDLVRITTAPATGNPSVAPQVNDSSDAAVEATCLALPTTAATEASSPFGLTRFSLGITATASTVSPPPDYPWRPLFQASPGDHDGKLPAIRAGVLEGWAVTVDSTAAAQLQMLVLMEFTEETP